MYLPFFDNRDSCPAGTRHEVDGTVGDGAQRRFSIRLFFELDRKVAEYAC